MGLRSSEVTQYNTSKAETRRVITKAEIQSREKGDEFCIR